MLRRERRRRRFPSRSPRGRKTVTVGSLTLVIVRSPVGDVVVASGTVQLLRARSFAGPETNLLWRLCDGVAGDRQQCDVITARTQSFAMPSCPDD